MSGSRRRKLKSYVLQGESLFSLYLSLFLPSINAMFEIVNPELIVDLSLDTTYVDMFFSLFYAKYIIRSFKLMFLAS